jgi:hypothetical protein
MARFRAYDPASINKRKEVIQCLIPSAVTSLGSPARLFEPRDGRLCARCQRDNTEARRAKARRAFLRRRADMTAALAASPQSADSLTCPNACADRARMNVDAAHKPFKER